jgi:hypothetical protein
MSLPEGWPENVKYYNSILYQKGVDRVAEFKLPELQLSNLDVFSVPRRHPAYPGRGARVLHEIIKKGEDVAYYAGFYRPAMVAPNNGYLFDTYNKEKNMVVDALLCGNATRFFNDIRGMNREANLVAVDASFALGTVTLWTIVFLATRDIQVGEELLINYQADGHERYWEPPEVIDLTIEPVHIKREPPLVEEALGDLDDDDDDEQESNSTHTKRDRELEEDDDDDDEDSDCECPKCGILHAQGRTSRLCPQCENKRHHELCMNDAGRHLARKLRNRLRNQGLKPPYPSVDFVRELIESSSIPDGADIHRYTVVVKDFEKPLTLENLKLEKGRRPHRRKNRRKEAKE